MSLLHPTLSHAEIDRLYAEHCKAVHDAALAAAVKQGYDSLGNGGRRKRDLPGAP